MTITESNPAVRNGVDTATLFATIDAVRAQPEAAQFQFRATNRWVSGTHSRGYVQGFFGVGAEDMSREEPFVLNADHPTVLVGTDEGPTPVEYVLHALAACLTAGVANISAARKVTLRRVEPADAEAIRRIFLLALCRPPTEAEHARLAKLMAEAEAEPQATRREVIEDLFWSVLTGREFLFNH